MPDMYRKIKAKVKLTQKKHTHTHKMLKLNLLLQGILYIFLGSLNALFMFSFSFFKCLILISILRNRSVIVTHDNLVDLVMLILNGWLFNKNPSTHPTRWQDGLGPPGQPYLTRSFFFLRGGAGFQPTSPFWPVLHNSPRKRGRWVDLLHYIFYFYYKFLIFFSVFLFLNTFGRSTHQPMAEQIGIFKSLFQSNMSRLTPFLALYGGRIGPFYHPTYF